MRERGITLLLALASLLAFYGLWLRPEPSLDPDANIARPTTAERRGNGYAALYEWLQRSGVGVRSLRERYMALQDLDVPPRGNLLILSLPAVEVFRTDELGALDQWIRRGNTLLINAALLDQPAWAARRSSGAVVEIESLTAIEFETRKVREARLDDTPLSQRVREADERDAQDEDDERRRRRRSEEGEDERQFGMTPANCSMCPRKSCSPPPGPRVARRCEIAGARDGLRSAGMVAAHAVRQFRAHAGANRRWRRRVVRAARGRRTRAAESPAARCSPTARWAMPTIRCCSPTSSAPRCRAMAWCCSTICARDFPQVTTRRGFYRRPAPVQDDVHRARPVAGLGARLHETARAGHRDARSFRGRTGAARWRFDRAHRRAAHTAQRLFDLFFDGVARAARRAGGDAHERSEQWHWLERHGAMLPQELDQLKTWYADAHAARKLPLVPLQNLLDTLEKRLKT